MGHLLVSNAFFSSGRRIPVIPAPPHVGLKNFLRTDAVAALRTDAVAALRTDAVAAFRTDAVAAFRTDAVAALRTDAVAALCTDAVADTNAEIHLPLRFLSLATVLLPPDPLQAYSSGSLLLVRRRREKF